MKHLVTSHDNPPFVKIQLKRYTAYYIRKADFHIAFGHEFLIIKRRSR